MRRIPLLAAVCALVFLACDNSPNDPTSFDRQFSAGESGLGLLNTDANTVLPAAIGIAHDGVIRLALVSANGNGAGLQHNRNVAWTTSDATVIAIAADDGTATASARAPGEATVCATLGATSACVLITVNAPPGVAYVVTLSASTAAAGSTVTVSAQLVDAANDPVAVAGRQVTWSASEGAFAPVVSTTDANGVATADYTAGTVAGTTHVLTAVDELSMTGSSAPLLVIAGAPASLTAHAGDGQSAQAGTAVAVPPAVRVSDAYGNSVEGAMVTFTVSAGGGAVADATSATDAGGVATVGSWILGNTQGANTLSAASGDLPAVTFNATATAGAATGLAMQTQPSGAAQAGIVFGQQPSVQLVDAFGNAVTTAGVAVTASVATTTSAGVLLGTRTVTTDATGRATFTDLRIDGFVGTRTLRFAATGLAQAVSSAIVVSAGPAAVLRILSQPTTAQAGVTMVPPPQVQMTDQFTNPASATGVVTAALESSPVAALEGTLAVTLNATGGAAFTNLRVAGLAGVYRIRFTTGSISGLSASIVVSAGAAHHLLVTTQPSATAIAGIALTQQPAVSVLDVYNNTVLAAGRTVSVQLAGPGTVLGTTTAITLANGIATFTDLAIGSTIGPRNLLFSSPGLIGTPSGTIIVSAGAATRLVIQTSPPTPVPAGVDFIISPVIQMRDAFGSPVKEAGRTVTVSLASGVIVTDGIPSAELAGTLSAVTDANGSATFTSLRINGSVGIYTLRFESSGLTEVVSAPVQVLNGSTHHIVFLVEPPSTVQAGVIFSPGPAIRLEDVFNNPVLGSHQVSVRIVTGGGAISGSPVFSSNGIATFPALAITGLPGVRTIEFSAGIVAVIQRTIEVTAGQ
jgi:hypothetical protein